MTEDLGVRGENKGIFGGCGIDNSLLFFFLLLVVLFTSSGCFNRREDDSLLFFFLILVVLFCSESFCF